MLGDFAKKCIESTLAVFRIKPPETCGCEQRRQWLNALWFHIIDAIRTIRIRIAYRLFGQYRHEPVVELVPVVVDLDAFESPWDAMTVHPRDYFVTSDIDKANTLRLSGFRVEMKDANAI